MALLFVVVVCAATFGGFGAWIATQKNREPIEGLILGVLFGPLGCLVEAILPSAGSSPTRPTRSSRGRDRVAWMPDYRDDWDDAPKVVSSDGMDEQILSFLNETKPKESNGNIDMDAISKADHRPRA